MADDCEARLAALGLTLPDAPAPAANYVPFCLSNGLLFMAGQVSRAADGNGIKGRLGENLSIAEGQKAAEAACLNLLAQIKTALGSLERVGQVLKLTGFVNSTPDFVDHPQVINGASDLMVAVFGDRGRHARAAVGMASLPFGFAVEVDAVLAVN
ncbi:MULTISPECIES: RidA family protein [Rhodomicrobium]|uniref:RidA family protein n=1 Tax=Rhodomicrobium TaxID=1068 RepID=UPI000B4AC705|nr:MULTISPECIES: RidA family protein [Rhodomicrobium]